MTDYTPEQIKAANALAAVVERATERAWTAELKNELKAALAAYRSHTP